MKIRLIAEDSKMPNFAIMKISAYWKKQGADVGWYSPLFDIDSDIIYISKIFAWSEDPTKYIPMPPNAQIIKGGTGYNKYATLPPEIEEQDELDYSLYPECDYSIVFTTRGCIRRCGFCIVKEKEGLIHDITPVKLNPKGKYIVVFDNNFFASGTWRARLDHLKDFNQPIEFNTGIDLRILTEEQCEALSKCKIKSIHCAWDNYEDKDKILPKLDLLTKYIKPYKIVCYVLVGYKNKEIIKEDIERVNTIWSKGVYPFVMGYMNFNDPTYEKSQSVKDFARWCNNRFVFKSCTWEDYKKHKTQKKSIANTFAELTQDLLT